MNRREALKHTALIMGYTISSSTIAAVLNSCKSEPELAWNPVMFSKQQAAVVADITERILPKSDTPGAKDLKLASFVDKMAKDLFTSQDQQQFKAWVDAFDKNCEDTFGKSFVNCTEEQQVEILMKYEKNTPALLSSIWGFPTNETGDEPETGREPVSYYRTLKDLTLLGYFSSEEVGKNILSYDPLPGVYLPCIPVSQVGNVWTE